MKPLKYKKKRWTKFSQILMSEDIKLILTV